VIFTVFGYVCLLPSAFCRFYYQSRNRLCKSIPERILNKPKENHQSVRYELMYGREVTKAIRDFPVAYLPVGCLERHGDHLPVGLDLLKAHKICCLAAEHIGGLVFPPHYYSGIHRMSDEQKKKYTGEWGNIYTDQSAQTSLTDVIEQIALAGIKVLVLYSGHYPECQRDMLQEIAGAFRQKKTIAVIPFYESLVVQGDHAGISETSFMLYLHNQLVDMSRISKINYREHDWQDWNSPEKATVEKGEKDTEVVLEYLQNSIRESLQF
jgi:creatinine amidohydrolase